MVKSNTITRLTIIIAVVKQVIPKQVNIETVLLYSSQQESFAEISNMMWIRFSAGFLLQ